MWEREEGIKGEGREGKKEEGVKNSLPTAAHIQMVPNLRWFNLGYFDFMNSARAACARNYMKFSTVYYKIGLVLEDFAQLSSNVAF